MLYRFLYLSKNEKDLKTAFQWARHVYEAVTKQQYPTLMNYNMDNDEDEENGPWKGIMFL